MRERREGGGREKEGERTGGKGDEPGAQGECCAETDKDGVKGEKESLDALKASLAHHFHPLTVKQNTTTSKP